MNASEPGIAELVRGAALFLFDFDGTLVDSNAIKLDAFDAVFASDLTEFPEIRTYCRGNHHTPRGDKFRHVVRNILKKPYTAEMEKDLSARYAALTTRAVIEAPEILGAQAFLQEASAKAPLGLISGTPDAVLKEILAARGWNGYFRWIQGAPQLKAEWIRARMAETGARPDETLFFGDTDEDRRSGQAAGCRFVPIREAALRGAALFQENFESMNAVLRRRKGHESSCSSD